MDVGMLSSYCSLSDFCSHLLKLFSFPFFFFPFSLHSSTLYYRIYNVGANTLVYTSSYSVSPATNTTISNLSPGTSYTFNISATNSKGQVFSTTTVTATTGTMVPSLSTVAGSTTATSVSLTWNVPTNNGSYSGPPVTPATLYGYAVYINSALKTFVFTRAYTITGLSAGITSTVGVAPIYSIFGLLGIGRATTASVTTLRAFSIQNWPVTAYQGIANANITFTSQGATGTTVVTPSVSPSGGTFSWSPTTLSWATNVNPVTSAFTMTASTVGTWTVTFGVSNTGASAYTTPTAVLNVTVVPIIVTQLTPAYGTFGTRVNVSMNYM